MGQMLLKVACLHLVNNVHSGQLLACSGDLRQSYTCQLVDTQAATNVQNGLCIKLGPLGWTGRWNSRLWKPDL